MSTYPNKNFPIMSIYPNKDELILIKKRWILHIKSNITITLQKKKKIKSIIFVYKKIDF